MNAHFQEAAYFLNEEGNEKAAIMHCDYALSFCREFETQRGRSRLVENADELRALRMESVQRAAQLMQEYGHDEVAQKYWMDGIREFGEPVRVLYGVHCYERQRFDEGSFALMRETENLEISRFFEKAWKCLKSLEMLTFFVYMDSHFS